MLSAGQAAHCPMMVPVLEAIHVAHRGRGRPRPAPEAGAGRQGLLLTGQPGLAARPPHPRHDPGQGRPGGPPSRQRLTRWTPTDLRRRNAQEPQHRGTRLQSPQASPSPGHPLRQARRAPPDNHPHHQHQPPAQTTYITDPSSTDPASPTPNTSISLTYDTLKREEPSISCPREPAPLSSFHHGCPVAPVPDPGSQECGRSQGPAGRALRLAHGPVPSRDRDTGRPGAA